MTRWRRRRGAHERRGLSDGEAFALFSERFGSTVGESVRSAAASLDEMRATGHVDHAQLRESIGALQAARTALAADERGAPWVTDRPRLEVIFELESRYEEGVLLRADAPGEDERAFMDAKLLALREILNSIKAGAPIKGSGSPS